MRAVSETERLEALYGLRILDTGSERHFDAVCETARDLFAVSIALVSLVDRDRVWFKAKCGIDVDGVPRELAFCRHTIESDEVLVSPDLTQDERFRDNSLVVGEPHFRFYAGAPLIFRPGLRLGTLCLIDMKPRSFSPQDAERLQKLADLVVAHLRLNEANLRNEAELAARRKAEIALQDSESRYRILAEHASDLIILGHDDGRRSYISPAVLPMLGYSPDEAKRLHMREVIHPEDLSRVFATTSGLGPAAPRAAVVFRMRRRDGTSLFAEAAFTRVEENGEVTIVTAIRDVSERERQAAELTRAKELAEEAQAKAELANRSKTEFLASMSHEIRTPLNGILGYAELLMGAEGLGVDQRRSVERIQSAGSALLTVVDDVLDFSRIEAGQIVLDPVPFSPKALVGDAVSIVSSVAERKGLPIRTAIDPRLPPALIGDEARLRQVLLNLLNNAVKFTSDGEVAVSLNHGGSGPDGEIVVFSVRDTGIGIPEEARGRLFKRFSQVDGSIRRDFGGTGLGLAISKQLVELMQGSISVESRAGEGSCFTFTVTLPQAEAWLVRPGATAEAARTGRSARILLVEDLDINQELATAVLEGAGHRVDVVADGTEAVSAVQLKPYDVVLMDVQMPGLDGLAATRLIRALDHPARAVPIVAMTANVLPQQVSACRQAGMTDHVGKPFKREELFAAIERALGAAPPASAPAPVLPMPPLLDEEALEGLAAVGGEALVTRLLNQFAVDAGRRFAAPQDRGETSRDAHALTSSAGMLGLSRLSKACAALERACLDEAPAEGLLGEVRGLVAPSLGAARAWQESHG